MLHRRGLRLEDVRAEVVELCKDPEARARLKLETLLRYYDRDPSPWEGLDESDHDKIVELREQLRILALAMDAAILRHDFDGFARHHEQHLEAEIRLRQLLE